MNLRVVRRASGKGLNQAAREMGVQPSSLSNWETGKIKPDMSSLERLADFYGVTLDQLAGRAPFDAPASAAS